MKKKIIEQPKEQKKVPFFFAMNLKGSDISQATKQAQERDAMYADLIERRRKFIQQFDPKKQYHPLKQFGMWLSQKKVAESITKRLFVEMYLNNGDKRHFWVALDDVTFEWEGKKYLTDHESFSYSSDVGAFCATYHEHFSLPIRRDVPLHKLKNVVAQDQPHIEYLANPDILQKYSVAKLVSMLYDIDDKTALMQQMLMLIFIILGSNVITLLLVILVLAFKH